MVRRVTLVLAMMLLLGGCAAKAPGVTGFDCYLDTEGTRLAAQKAGPDAVQWCRKWRYANFGAETN